MKLPKKSRQLKIKSVSLKELACYGQSGCPADVGCGEDCSDPNPKDCD